MEIERRNVLIIVTDIILAHELSTIVFTKDARISNNGFFSSSFWKDDERNERPLYHYFIDFYNLPANFSRISKRNSMTKKFDVIYVITNVSKNKSMIGYCKKLSSRQIGKKIVLINMPKLNNCSFIEVGEESCCLPFRKSLHGEILEMNAPDICSLYECVEKLCL